MTHTYLVTGMTCSGCQAKVQEILQQVKGVTNVSIDLTKGTATIDMLTHVSTDKLQAALAAYPKYTINEFREPVTVPVQQDEKRSWVITYKPILLIFGYIAAATFLVEVTDGGFSLMRWMNHFMAGFFLIFSFFKLLDLNGFADSYSTYDIIAKRWRGWGMVYAVIELALGLAYLVNFQPVLVNTVTLVVMAISIVGVMQSVLNKRKIKCACLGAVFNLPMSTVTIIEDALMIAMSAVMLLKLTN